MPLRIQVLQHELFEGPGLMEEWAHSQGHTIAVTEMYNCQQLPGLQTFDWLVIMGGSMSVNDEALYTWLKAEKKLVYAAIEAGKTVIGICLGSQIIANVLGSRVYTNACKEIGWYPVVLTNEGKEVLGSLWQNQVFFHWHGETFDLPVGSIRLAASAACGNQAFKYAGRVYGLQFHPETNSQTLHQMVNAGASELIKAEYVMEPAEVLAKEHYLQQTRPLMFNWLNTL